jgi:hypothetical protein
MSSKFVQVVFNFPGKGVIFPAPIGANDSAQHGDSLHLELKPGLNTVSRAAFDYWLPRLKGVRSKHVKGTYILSADEAEPPITQETLAERRRQLERDRFELERDRIQYERDKIEYERTRYGLRS